MKRGGMFGHAQDGKMLAQSVKASNAEAQVYNSTPEGMFKTLMKDQWDGQSGSLKSMPGNINYGGDNETYVNGTFEDWWKSGVWMDAFDAWDTDGHRYTSDG